MMMHPLLGIQSGEITFVSYFPRICASREVGARRAKRRAIVGPRPLVSALTSSAPSRTAPRTPRSAMVRAFLRRPRRSRARASTSALPSRTPRPRGVLLPRPNFSLTSPRPPPLQADDRHTIVLLQPTGNKSSRTFLDYERVSLAMDGASRASRGCERWRISRRRFERPTRRDVSALERPPTPPRPPSHPAAPSAVRAFPQACARCSRSA